MISPEDFWKGRDEKYAEELTDEIRSNAENTLAKVNELLTRAGRTMDRCASGWRPRAVNEATANSGAASRHLTGQAADVVDLDRSLAHWCVNHLGDLEEIGLWMEDPRWTPTWTHLQTVPPKSGKLVYIPSSAPARDPDFPVSWA